MTAPPILEPRKSEAESLRRRRWRVVISEIETGVAVSSSVCWRLKEVVPPTSTGWAEVWELVGSMLAKLERGRDKYWLQ